MLVKSLQMCLEIKHEQCLAKVPQHRSLDIENFLSGTHPNPRHIWSRRVCGYVLSSLLFTRANSIFGWKLAQFVESDGLAWCSVLDLQTNHRLWSFAHKFIW